MEGKLHSNYAIKIFMLCLVIFLSDKLIASSFSTAVNGNWNNPGCWTNANIPAFNISDTIIIKHHIVLPSNLNLLNGAHVLIESTGGLCGHFEVNVNTNASIIKYGILEIDVLNQSGGMVNLMPPGNTIFTQYGLLTGGTFNNTSNFAVGPWFECQMPEYQFLNGLNENANSRINLFPNPVETTLNIDIPISIKSYLLCVYDAQGVCVLIKEIHGTEIQVDLSGLFAGLYFLQLANGASNTFAKFNKL